MKIFSIRDNAIEAFTQPFFAPTMGSAIRTFSDAVNDSQTMFFKHPDDYTLFELGEFTEGTGVIVGREPTRVISANEVKVQISGDIE